MYIYITYTVKGYSRISKSHLSSFHQFPAMVDHMLDAIESLVESAMETFADMESYDSHMIADAYKSLQVLK